MIDYRFFFFILGAIGGASAVIAFIASTKIDYTPKIKKPDYSWVAPKEL